MLIRVYGFVIAVVGVLSFILYGVDKYRAKTAMTRISERTLHQVDLMGGWVGGWVGRRFFRHKTQKGAFRRIAVLICAVHIVLVAGVVWVSLR